MPNAHDTSLPSASAEEVTLTLDRAVAAHLMADLVNFGPERLYSTRNRWSYVARRLLGALEAQQGGRETPDPDAPIEPTERDIVHRDTKPEKRDFLEVIDEMRAEVAGDPEASAAVQTMADRVHAELDALKDEGPSLPPWRVEPQPELSDMKGGGGVPLWRFDGALWSRAHLEMLILTAAPDEYAGGDVVRGFWLEESDGLRLLAEDEWHETHPAQAGLFEAQAPAFYVIAPKLVRVPRSVIGTTDGSAWSTEHRWRMTLDEAEEELEGLGYPGARPIGDEWWYQPEASGSGAVCHPGEDSSPTDAYVTQAAPLQSTTAAEPEPAATLHLHHEADGYMGHLSVAGSPTRAARVDGATSIASALRAIADQLDPDPSPGLSSEDARELLHDAQAERLRWRELSTSAVMPASVAQADKWLPMYERLCAHLEAIANGQPPTCSECEGLKKEIERQRTVIRRCNSRHERDQSKIENLRAVHKETHAALAACGPETHDIANHDHAEAVRRLALMREQATELHPETIRRALRDGTLQGWQVRRRWRIKEAELDRWVESGGANAEGREDRAGDLRTEPGPLPDPRAGAGQGPRSDPRREPGERSGSPAAAPKRARRRKVSLKERIAAEAARLRRAVAEEA